MARKVQDVMSKQPIQLDRQTTLVEAATKMCDANVGAVIVVEDGKIMGIATDRDIAIRAVAKGKDPNTTRLSEICSCDLTTVLANDDVDRAIELMRQKAIRRLPVVDSQNRAVGILSLGDLAQARDKRSVLGQISAAPPNQ